MREQRIIISESIICQCFPLQVSSQTITLNKKGMLITFLHLNNNFGFWFLEEAKCGNNPCQNGGSCTELDAEFQCSCAPGYRGKKCQGN